MNIPIVAEEIIWRRVAPINLRLPVIRREEKKALVVVISLKRKRVFSTAENPSAAVIM